MTCDAEQPDYIYRAAALLATPEERQEFMRSVASRLEATVPTAK